MLCSLCVSIFQQNPGTSTRIVRGNHHVNARDLRVAAQQGCYLCSDLILQYDDEADELTFDSTVETSHTEVFLSFNLDLTFADSLIGTLSFEFAQGLSIATYELVYTNSLERPVNYDSFLRAIRRDIPDKPWNVRNDGFPSSTTKVPESTGDPEVLKVAGHWLSRCLKFHSSCEDESFLAQTPWYPKRLLDVSAPSGRPRLVITKDEEPKERYATLSHCWGPKAICCLTADNSKDYESGIPWEELTNTFRDAITATQMLNIRYLWIDSLCIMQAGEGSKEDWQEHAVAMRMVYTNSLLNIAAARAEEGSDGAFALRSETFLRPCHVMWEWPSSFHEYDPEAVWTIRVPHHHSAMSIKILPLYSRGWVVQERFLAPRVLHFGEDRIVWECNGLPFAEESFPIGFQDSCPDYKAILQWTFSLSDDLQTVPDTHDPAQHLNDPTHVLWQDLVTNYSSCDLSFPDKDIFIALAGIAQKIGKLYNNQYIAGLFRQHLPFDLLWQNKGVLSETYRAPSWSWASRDGPVDMRAFSECPFCDKCCNRVADLKDARMDLVDDDNPYGQVKYAELTLSGYLIPCLVESSAKAGTGLRQRLVMNPQLKPKDGPLFGSANSNKATMFWGEADIDDEDKALRGFSSRSQSAAWALPIIELKPEPRSSPYKHRGLLVEQTADGKYRRIGIYQLEGRIINKVIENNICRQQTIGLV